MERIQIIDLLQFALSVNSMRFQHCVLNSPAAYDQFNILFITQ